MAKATGAKIVRSAGLALVFGALVGVVYGLLRGSVWSGLTYGAIFGIGFAVLLAVGQRSSAMNGLTARQRRQVREAIRTGEGVSDPDLAPALIEEGRTLLATPLTPRNAGIAAGMFFAFGVGAAVLGIATYGWSGLVVGGFLILCGVALLAQVFTVTERRRSLAAQAVQATEERTGVS